MFASIWKPLAYVSATALSVLGVISTRSRKARYYLHLTLYLGTMGFCSILGVVYSLALSLVGQRLNINFLTARSFYYLCSPLIGVTLEVEGREHLEQLNSGAGGKSAVLVGNHQSFLDILYLGRIFPKRAVIMAKKELRWAPLLGQYLTLSGAVMVDRANSSNAVKMMHHVGEIMKRKGVALWIFPEGTRSLREENDLLKFKKGAFHLAVQAGVPIIPVVCENYHRLFDGKNRFERGTLKIRILPPVSTDGLTAEDVTSLSDRVREDMLTALKEISISSPVIESDESAPLVSSTGTRKASSSYGTERDSSSSEIRRRISSSPSVAGKEAAELGAVDGGVTAGITEAVTSGIRSEEEDSDEGAVLVERPVE